MHLPPPRTAEQAFAPYVSSVCAARRFSTGDLEQWDQEPLLWTVQLLLSGLATNAVLHTGGTGCTVGVA